MHAVLLEALAVTNTHPRWNYVPRRHSAREVHIWCARRLGLP